MSHILRHGHRFDSEMLTASSMRGWLLTAMLVLAVIFALVSLSEPPAQALPGPSATPTGTEAKLLGAEITPVHAPSEPALGQEDFDMTGLRPHGG